MFAAFTALGFAFDRTASVPDFRLVRAEERLFVEAVTANPTGNLEFDIKQMPPDPPEDYWHYIEHDMPQKFGSPLLSKLRKKYWEREDVGNNPFVLAIADFHAPASMNGPVPHFLVTCTALVLNGVRQRTDDKYPQAKRIGDHIVRKKVVPTNFFAQEGARHVSAVLFSNAGTMSKFNRMGVLAGFGDPEVSLWRIGGLNDLTPGATMPIEFEMNIEDPNYSEGWADEMEIYHNPNALVRLPEGCFPTSRSSFSTKMVTCRGTLEATPVSFIQKRYLEHPSVSSLGCSSEICLE